MIHWRWIQKTWFVMPWNNHRYMRFKVLTCSLCAIVQIRILQNDPKDIFVAVALPNPSFFWGKAAMLRAYFINNTKKEEKRKKTKRKEIENKKQRTKKWGTKFLLIFYIFCSNLILVHNVFYLNLIFRDVISDDGIIFCVRCRGNIFSIYDICSSVHFLSCNYNSYATRWGPPKRKWNTLWNASYGAGTFMVCFFSVQAYCHSITSVIICNALILYSYKYVVLKWLMFWFLKF